MKKDLEFIERLTHELEALENLIDNEILEDYGRIGQSLHERQYYAGVLCFQRFL